MSYVDPDYAVAAATASSDAYNILVDDVKDHESRILGQAFSGVQVKRATTQSISDSTYTSVIWTAETLDIGGWWTSGTDIVVPSSAIPTGFTTIALEVLVNIRFATNGTGLRAFQLYVNGVPSVVATNYSGLSGDNTTVVGFDTAVVAAADIVTIRAYQSSGGSLNLAGGAALVKRLGGVA